MENKIYIVDAFTDEVFKGNPAAVCPLEDWLPDELMQKIAMENNLSETAFFIKDDGYKLRWFTPEYEIELCGHGTLAASHIIFNYIEPNLNTIEFNTMSGIIRVERDINKISMEFPVIEGNRIEVMPEIIEALGVIPIEMYSGRNLMVVLNDEEDVKYLQPNMEILKTLDYHGVIVTAKGKAVDFVSRFFIPNSVISEDPVTGSAHCTMAPYWAKRLKKSSLTAKQLSKRGGIVYCTLENDKVLLSGKSKLYLEGCITF